MAEIRRFFERYKAAVYEKDLEAFASLYATNVRVFDLWAQWSVEGLDAWKSTARDWFGSLGDERVVVEVTDTQSLQVDGLAFASATLTYKAVSVDGKELRSLQNRLTWVLQQHNGGWAIIHEHTSAPVNPETGKAVFKR